MRETKSHPLNFCMNKSHNVRISWHTVGISSAPPFSFHFCQSALTSFISEHWFVSTDFYFLSQWEVPWSNGKHWGFSLGRSFVSRIHCSLLSLSPWPERAMIYPSLPLVHTLTSSTPVRGRYYNYSIFQMRKLRHRKNMAEVQLVFQPRQPDAHF